MFTFYCNMYDNVIEMKYRPFPFLSKNFNGKNGIHKYQDRKKWNLGKNKMEIWEKLKLIL